MRISPNSMRNFVSKLERFRLWRKLESKSESTTRFLTVGPIEYSAGELTSAKIQQVGLKIAPPPYFGEGVPVQRKKKKKLSFIIAVHNPVPLCQKVSGPFDPSSHHRPSSRRYMVVTRGSLDRLLNLHLKGRTWTVVLSGQPHP